MASEGPNNPTTGIDLDLAGNTPWNTTIRIVSSNNSYATVGLGFAPPDSSNYLTSGGHGFAIPTGATINGIVVDVEVKSSSSGTALDYCALTKDQTSLIGIARSSGGTISTTEGYITYGTSSDLWGETWTDTEINDSNFGAAFYAVNNGSGAATVSVDHIRITVYYTEVSGARMLAISFVGT